MSTDAYFIAVIVINLLNLAFLTFLCWPQRVDKNLIRVIRQFERERDCMLRVEMVEAENVYLRNPKR